MEKLNLVNSVLFTGGWAKTGLYYETVQEIFKVCFPGQLQLFKFQLSTFAGVMTAYIAFGNKDIKSRAERFLSSITNSIETVLRRNVEVRMGLIADGENSINRIKAVESPDSMAVA
ncbi:uncharacterized protein LOC131235115 isoform X1 [Magnolia sinica]|uniref:uncharacterized protein LOC131235115 isoform X1 n=1 Tax=Magnolia sinica TaxID=86752 RepID=UPI002658A07E|nr:uncharacterized protein LOC131235115 isoform X1 [Magnolia sinica]